MAGVPLGGVGAGCIEFAHDGRLRNITINNNRTADERIPVSEGTFVAVRDLQRGKVTTRLLQAGSALPFEGAGIVPPYAAAQQMNWRGLYPCAHYELEDSQFPLELTWSAMSPVIPYDVDASTLPVVFVSLHFKNPTDTTHTVSAVFNWENLCGCTAHSLPEARGPILPVAVTETGEYVRLGHADAAEEEEENSQPPPVAGLDFGCRGDYQTNADGQYCLVAEPGRNADITTMAWDERDPGDLQEFWSQFNYKGRLDDRMAPNKKNHSGALCCSFDLEAGRSQTVAFALAWYCPKFEVNGASLGNGYTVKYGSALEVVNQAVKHHQYYHRAVEDWQSRIMSSSLPRWFNKMLLNSNHVFSTNSILTRDGRFAMMETPDAPLTGALDRRFHSSLGTLLLFPDFEQRELDEFARAVDPEHPGRIFRYLGRGCLHEPHHGTDTDELMDINAKFVLMVYRNYRLTGKRFVLDHLFPRLRQAMEYMQQHDRDRDGLPEQSGRSMTYDDWQVQGVNSYTASLWLAALRAYARLAHSVGLEKEAKYYDKLFAKAAKSFVRQLWRESGGYFRLYQDETAEEALPAAHNACHDGQLAGQWYADFLCLGHLVPEEHIRKALGAICGCNDMRHGVARAVIPGEAGSENAAAHPDAKQTGTSWPSFSLTHFCCLLMSHGYPDRALYITQKAYKNTQVRRGRRFNQPLGWDLATNDASGWGMDRHMGSTAAWHVLFALQGFHLDLAEQVLWLRPNLPQGVRRLSAPLLTPACFGWLRYREFTHDRYRQKVEISFDGPIRLRKIILRIPQQVTGVEVECVTTEGPELTGHTFGKDGPERLVEIVPHEPVMVGSGLTLTLTQTEGTKVGLSQDGA
jgi:non-lysosomal glucosylceramidase